VHVTITQKNESADKLYFQFLSHALKEYEAYLEEALALEGGGVLAYARARTWIDANDGSETLKQYVKSEYWPCFETSKKVLYRVVGSDGVLTLFPAKIMTETGSYVIQDVSEGVSEGTVPWHRFKK
jgi:hypothetical protein